MSNGIASGVPPAAGGDAAGAVVCASIGELMTAIAQAAIVQAASVLAVSVIETIERIFVLPVEVSFRCRGYPSRRTYIGGVNPSLP
jgi:hypothetical protein